MKLFQHLSLAALLLMLCASAGAQNGYWQWTGNSYEGVPYHHRADYGNVTYFAQTIDYDVWAEGNSLAFKENYVGKYYAHVNYKKNGKADGESHNHQGEFASAHLALPYPPPSIKAGETLKMSMTLTRNTDCGWKYGKPQAALGPVAVYAGRTLVASMDTNKDSSIRQTVSFSFKMGRGTPGMKIPLSFTTQFAGKTQQIVYNYEWVESGSQQSTKTTNNKKKWWQW